MAENIPDMEEILAQMKEKFLETAQEKLERLNEILQELSSASNQDPALHEEFRREIHSLKGMGGTFQMPLVTKLCHAFEAFIEDESVFTTELINASHTYVDRITDLVDSDDASDENKLVQWLDGLPKKGEVVVPAQETGLPTAYVVSQNSEHLTVIDASLKQSGFHVICHNDPVSAFEDAFKDKPQLFVSAQNFTDFDGAELLRCLGAGKALSKTKFAMICPDRRQALEENLQGVQLLSEKNIEVDILNFIAIAVTA